MQEVTIRVRFSRECLGSVKRRRRGQVVFCMLRDAHEHVMFLPSWWRNLALYASKVANKCQHLVRRIDWDPIVDGAPRSNWRRIVVSARHDPKGRERYAMHEAFPPGSVIGVNAVLPDGMSIDDFGELMTIIGTYKGVSPFQDSSETYGTFEVLSVRSAVRGRGIEESQVKDKPASG